MAISVLQERATDISTTGTTLTLAFSSNITAGSAIHCAGSWGLASGSPTCSDNVNGSYGSALSTFNNSSATQSGTHFNKNNAGAGATTVSFVPPSSDFRGICIREIGGTSGLDAGSGKTNGQTTPGTGAGVIVGTSTTPSAQPGLLSAICMDIKAAHAVAAAAGFTAGLSGASNQWVNIGSLATESLRYTSTAAQQAKFTDSTGGSADSYITASVLYIEAGTVALAGSGATITSGALAPSLSIALTGQGITTAGGILVPSSSIAVGGQRATVTPGTLGVALSTTVTGQGATAASGSLAPASTLALSGQPASLTGGTVIPAMAAPLSGLISTAALGILTPALSGAIGGQGAILTPGAVAPNTDIALSGQSALSGIGTLSVSGDVTVALTGQMLSLAAGTIIPSSIDTGITQPGPLDWPPDRIADTAFRRKKKRRLREIEQPAHPVDPIRVGALGATPIPPAKTYDFRSLVELSGKSVEASRVEVDQEIARLLVEQQERDDEEAMTLILAALED